MEKKECSTCSKEPIGTIPIIRIIEKIDSLFDKNDYEEAGRILEYWEQEAKKLNDVKGLSEILSEEIGYYRKVLNKEKGLKAVNEALSILECQDVTDSVSNATIYLNCATTLKAFGEVNKAIGYYEIAKEVYERLLENDDFRLAGLYNNMATALSELKRFDEAKTSYLKAIDILKKKGGYGEVAVSYINLAQAYFDESLETNIPQDNKIDECVEIAYKVLDDESLERNGNYAFICDKCAPAFGFFGYFLYKEELEKRAKEIYSR